MPDPVVLPARFRLLHDSWMTHLKAEGKAPATRTSYSGGIRHFGAWLDRQPEPVTDWREVTRRHCRGYFADLIDLGRSQDTRRARHCAIDRFFQWCVAEGELEANPMDGLTMPSPASKPVPVLDLEQMRALLASLDKKSFLDIRDEAILRLFFDSGLRLDELRRLTVDRIDLINQTVTVTGKGGKTRTARFGMQTAKAVDRYLRHRSRHKYADRPEVWVSRLGTIGREGIRKMVKERCAAAGIGHVHPHMFRHSFAHHWLDNDGREGDLMQLAGWSSPAMLRRYGASAAAARARRAHETYGVGDRL